MKNSVMMAESYPRREPSTFAYKSNMVPVFQP